MKYDPDDVEAMMVSIDKARNRLRSISNFAKFLMSRPAAMINSLRNRVDSNEAQERFNDKRTTAEVRSV